MCFVFVFVCLRVLCGLVCLGVSSATVLMQITAALPLVFQSVAAIRTHVCPTKAIGSHTFLNIFVYFKKVEHMFTAEN